jgi:hypothetical protein
MNARHLFVTSVISASLAAAAASTAWAGEATTFVRSAPVVSASLRAGEGFQSYLDSTGRPGRSRAEVRAEVMQARVDGQLLAAGDATRHESFGTSTLARADVRQATLEARLHGELMPAGERTAYAAGTTAPVVARAPLALFAKMTRR